VIRDYLYTGRGHSFSIFSPSNPKQSVRPTTAPTVGKHTQPPNLTVFPTLPNIPPNIIIPRIRLLIQPLLRLRTALSLEISRFRHAFHVHISASAPHLSYTIFQKGTWWATHRPLPSPVLFIRSPPSSTGISRLSPAPEAAEPTFTVLPGNFEVTDSSTPDSLAT